MSRQARLKRKRQLLAHIKRELGDIRPKRVKRRALDVRETRNDTRSARRNLHKRQVEAHKDLDRLLKQFERLTDDDLTNDPSIDGTEGWELERIIKYLAVEIDLLREEIDERGKRLDDIAKRQGKQTRRYKRLKQKAHNQRERQNKLQARKDKVLRQIKAILKAIQEANDPEWPSDIIIAELLYHLNHLHFASPERAKLIEIGKIMVRWGIRVGEFPPFDSVECVHTSGSWHYRLDGVVIPCASSRLDYGGDGGEAIDANDADGGSDKEVAMYHELQRRY